MTFSGSNSHAIFWALAIHGSYSTGGAGAAVKRPARAQRVRIYIFERAREIDQALRQPIDAEFEVVFRKPPRPALNAMARRKEDMRRQFRVHRLMCQGLTLAEAEEQYEGIC